MTIDVSIPEQPQLTPEKASLRLQAWFAQQEELRTLKVAEVLERKTLGGFYFPEPVEGTNRLPLGGGFDLRLIHSITRNVDEAALENVKASDVKKLKLNLDDLFPTKPTLNLTLYRALSDAQRKFVDGLLDIKEGSPQMAIVPQADTEGQAKHVEAAEATKAVPDGPAFVEDPEQASVGEFYDDGETVWLLTDDGKALSWVQVDDPRPQEVAPVPKKKRTRKARV